MVKNGVVVPTLATANCGSITNSETFSQRLEENPGIKSPEKEEGFKVHLLKPWDKRSKSSLAKFKRGKITKKRVKIKGEKPVFLKKSGRNPRKKRFPTSIFSSSS